MLSSEYLRRRADLYWRLALVVGDDDIRRMVAERAQRLTTEVETLEASLSDPKVPDSASDDCEGYSSSWPSSCAMTSGTGIVCPGSRVRKMKPGRFLPLVPTMVLLCAGGSLVAGTVCAQVIDFGRIDTFESMGSGTQRGASPPKTIIGDSERHMVIFTILDADTETKIYWKSPDGSPSDRSTIMPGPGVQVFQTAGEFKIEALGDDHHSVKYGYMLFTLKK
jgi:hypothetical protein